MTLQQQYPSTSTSFRSNKKVRNSKVISLARTRKGPYSAHFSNCSIYLHILKQAVVLGQFFQQARAEGLTPILPPGTVVQEILFTWHMSAVNRFTPVLFATLANRGYSPHSRTVTAPPHPNGRGSQPPLVRFNHNAAPACPSPAPHSPGPHRAGPRCRRPAAGACTRSS